MLHYLFKTILILTLAFTAFSLAARVLGSTQPTNPALEGFTVGCEGKSQPCWYGIVPGVTTVEEARTTIQSWGRQGYYEATETLMDDSKLLIIANRQSKYACNTVLYSAQPSVIVSYFELSDCSNLEVVDVINNLDIPNVIEFADQFGIGLWVGFDKATLFIYYPIEFLTPRRNVSRIRVPALEKRGSSFRWHGFMTLWRYCQLEPKQYTCP